MAEEEVAEEVVEEEPKPKKKNGKAKADNGVSKKTMAETKTVGPKTESMKTMSSNANDFYPGKIFKLKTMADKNRL